MSPRGHKILFILLGLMCLCLCGFLVLLFTPFPQWLVNRAVDRFLEGPLGASIHIGDVGGNIFQRACLEEVEIRMEDGRMGGYIGAISVQYDWRQLVRGRWRFQEASVQKPFLYLDQEKKASTGQASKFPASSGKLPSLPAFQVDRLIITGGRLIDSQVPQVDSLGLMLSVQGGGDRIQTKIARCHFRLPQRDLMLRHLSGDMRFSADQVALFQLRAHTEASRFDFSGRAMVSPAFSCSLAVRADSLSLKELGVALGTKQPLRGNLLLEGQVQGDASGWGGSIQLSGQAQGYAINQLTADVHWREGRLELADLFVTASSITVGGWGYLTTDGVLPFFEADLVFREVDLSGLLERAPTSRLNGYLRISGKGRSQQNIQATADLDLSAGSLAGRSFQGVRGQVQFDRGRWMFHRGLEIELAGTHLLLWGSLDARQRLDTWAEIEVSEIGHLLDRPELRGSLRARCRARGPLADPEVAGQIEVLDLAHGSGHIKRVSGLFRLQGAVSREVGSFSVQFSDGGMGKLFVDRGHARGRFAPQRVYLDSVVVESPDGQLMAAAELSLVPGAWEIQVDSLMGTYRGYSLVNSGPLSLSRRENLIVLKQSKLLLEAGSLQVQGVLSPGSQIQGAASLEDVQLDAISPVLSSEHQISGPLSLNLRIDGTVQAPEVQASFLWKESRFNQVTFDQVQAEMVYLDGRITLEQFQARRGNSIIRGRGYLPLDLPKGKLLSAENWDLSFSGEGSSPDFLPLLANQVEDLTGPFAVEFRATGTPHQPHYGGFFHLRDGTLKLASMGNAIQNLAVQAHLDGQYVVIDRIEGQTPFRERNPFKRIWASLFSSKKKRKFEAFGRINLADLGFDVAVKGKSLYVNYLEEKAEAEMDADLRITGRKEPHLSGQITLLRGLITRSFSEPTRVAPAEERPTYSLDLSVHIPKNCWLRNEAANIELGGRMEVLQQMGQMSLLGNLETVRGTYFFYGNNFRIQRGLLTFDELTEINPQLDIKAWTEVDRERIELTIGGRMRSPTINLTSSSGYSEGDIITLLTLHQSPAGLDTLGAEAVVTSQAGDLFGNFVQSALNRKASNILGVDKFTVKPGPSGLHLRGAEITLGTYLSSKIYVEYSRRLSQESGEQVGVEYDLSRNLSLQGNRDVLGLYRVGFSLKWDY